MELDFVLPWNTATRGFCEFLNHCLNVPTPGPLHMLLALSGMQSPWKWKCCLLGGVWLFATPWTVARQAPLSMKLSRQEYWSGLSFPSPGDLPDPGIKPRSPALQAVSVRLLPPNSFPFLLIFLSLLPLTHQLRCLPEGRTLARPPCLPYSKHPNELSYHLPGTLKMLLAS